MTRARARTRAYPVLLLLLALVGLGVAGSGTARAADNGRWSVFPAPAGGASDKSPTSQDRQYFYLEGEPGATLKDKVSVSNLSREPMTFRIYGADAYNTARDGGFAVRGADEEQKDIGSWVALAKGELTIPPRTRADIPFTVTVPDDATPGDHPGAIVALSESIEEGQGDQAKGDVEVGVRRAVGARIYLRVGGPTLPALSVEDVVVDHGQPIVPGTGTSNATIHYTLVNRGNVSLRPRLTVSAKGLFGRKLLDREAKGLPLELLPGQKVQLTEKWSGAPQFDRVNVGLTVTSETGDLRETGRASFLAVPWLAVALLLAGAGGLAAWLVHRRRRRRAVKAGAGKRAEGRAEEPREEAPAEPDIEPDIEPGTAGESEAAGTASGPGRPEVRAGGGTA